MSLWRGAARRWPKVTDDEAVLEALALTLGATTDEAYDVADELTGNHRPRYAIGIIEQVEAALAIVRDRGGAPC